MLVFSRGKGRNAKSLLELAIKGGVIAKTAFRGDDVGLLALLQESPRQKQAFQYDIIPYRGTRGFLEDAVDVGFAEKEFLLQYIQIFDQSKIIVDVLNDLGNRLRRALNV